MKYLAISSSNRKMLGQSLLKLALLLFCFYSDATNAQTKDDYLVRKCPDSAYEECGYANASEDIVIPIGKYSICYTDTFRTMAIVSSDSGFTGIARNEKILFHVFAFDNGPDEPSEGLFRIVRNQFAKDEKIGFANLEGEVVLPAQYDFALPFTNGLSAYCTGCIARKTGEHYEMEGGKWGFINTKGKTVIKPVYDAALSFENGKAKVVLNGSNYLINTKGEIVGMMLETPK